MNDISHYRYDIRVDEEYFEKNEWIHSKLEKQSSSYTLVNLYLVSFRIQLDYELDPLDLNYMPINQTLEPTIVQVKSDYSKNL